MNVWISKLQCFYQINSSNFNFFFVRVTTFSGYIFKLFICHFQSKYKIMSLSNNEISYNYIVKEIILLNSFVLVLSLLTAESTSFFAFLVTKTFTESFSLFTSFGWKFILTFRLILSFWKYLGYIILLLISFLYYIKYIWF